MSHIAGDICARSRTCSGVSVIERLPFLWPDALAVLRLLGLRVLINAQRSIRPKNALWTRGLCKSDAWLRRFVQRGLPSSSPIILGLLPARFQEPCFLTTLIRSRTRPSAPSPAGFLTGADYLERPPPPEISSGWIVLTPRRQLPR